MTLSRWNAITAPYEFRLNFCNISMSFSDRTLFSDVSGTVSSGECLAIVGPNGSGKSTLIKILAKLLRQSSGDIVITDRGVRLEGGAYRSSIGAVAPYLEYYNMLTGLENLVLFAKLRGKDYSRQKALRILEMVELKSSADNLVQTYSTGMKQRLKCAVLTMIDPPIWMLDEPFSFLDNHGRAMLHKILSDAKHRSKAIILATNSPEEAKLAQTTVELGKSVKSAAL